jgi:hypothetical protein
LLVADASSARRVTPFCSWTPSWTPFCSLRTPFLVLVVLLVLGVGVSSVLRIVDTVLLVVDAPFSSSLCCGRHSDAVVLVLGSGSARRGRRRGRRCARRGFLPSLCTKNHGTPRNTKTTEGRPYESSRRSNISSQSISGATGSRFRSLDGVHQEPRGSTPCAPGTSDEGPFLPSLCTGNHTYRPPVQQVPRGRRPVPRIRGHPPSIDREPVVARDRHGVRAPHSIDEPVEARNRRGS